MGSDPPFVENTLKMAIADTIIIIVVGTGIGLGLTSEGSCSVRAGAAYIIHSIS